MSNGLRPGPCCTVQMGRHKQCPDWHNNLNGEFVQSMKITMTVSSLMASCKFWSGSCIAYPGNPVELGMPATMSLIMKVKVPEASSNHRLTSIKLESWVNKSVESVESSESRKS